MNASDGTNPNEKPDDSQSNDQQKRKGRKNLRMDKIKNEKNLQVTFKRRAGLFKKASKLNTLCGAESALVVFSPGNKAYSYGHPNVETIGNRFLNINGGPTPPTNPLIFSHHEVNNHQLNQELIHKERLVELERQRNKEFNHTFKPNINKMSYEELNQLQKDILRFKSVFQARTKDATSLGGLTNNLNGPNLDQRGDRSVGFTIPSGINMIGYPNTGDLTHWASSSISSYPAPFNLNMGYMFQYPYGATGSSQGLGGSDGSNILVYNYNNLGSEASYVDMTTIISNTETTDETQTDVPNNSQSQGSRHNNGRRGHF